MEVLIADILYNSFSWVETACGRLWQKKVCRVNRVSKSEGVQEEVAESSPAVQSLNVKLHLKTRFHHYFINKEITQVMFEYLLSAKRYAR